MTNEDPIEKVIGSFGWYQAWILFLIAIGSMPTDYQVSNVVFILPSVEYVCMDEEAYNITNHCPCANPVYDTSIIESSVTSTWNLICDRAHLASLAQSFLQIGILAGSIFYGYISDRYGRKFSCLMAMYSQVIFVAASAVMPELWMFIATRFFIGTGVGGISICCYVMLIELSGKSFRPYIIGLAEISFVVCYTTLPGLAYLFRNWRQLQLVMSVPWVLIVSYYFLIPESPRWLITVGRKEEAINVLTHIAKKNKLPTTDIRKTVDTLIEETITEDTEQYGTYLDIIKSPKIRMYTLITALVWLCCAHTFYGINQYIGRLQGNIYLNVMLSGLSITPGMVLVVFATIKYRRKNSIVFSFIVAGVSLLTFVFLPIDLHILRLIMALIGVTSAYASFIQAFLCTSEIFPTVIRNSALGFASVFARFGGFIAPFVVNIGIEWVSIVIFSSLAFCGALLCLFLPETKGVTLLNTIEQTENVQKSQKSTVSI